MASTLCGRLITFRYPVGGFRKRRNSSTHSKLASLAGIAGLLKAMENLRFTFINKAAEFSDVLKMGRTPLQDAVPMTLGQEFGIYAVMLEEDEARLSEAVVLVRKINLGATAIGTGITAHPEYASRVRDHLSIIVGIDLITAPNLVEATQDCGSFVHLSGVLKRIAVKISKVCNDLRLLSSGPHAGFGEINLPPRQAGSSIMPGKVNPVMWPALSCIQRRRSCKSWGHFLVTLFWNLLQGIGLLPSIAR